MSGYSCTGCPPGNPSGGCCSVVLVSAMEVMDDTRTKSSCVLRLLRLSTIQKRVPFGFFLSGLGISPPQDKSRRESVRCCGIAIVKRARPRSDHGALTARSNGDI